MFSSKQGTCMPHITRDWNYCLQDFLYLIETTLFACVCCTKQLAYNISITLSFQSVHWSRTNIKSLVDWRRSVISFSGKQFGWESCEYEKPGSRGGATGNCEWAPVWCDEVSGCDRVSATFRCQECSDIRTRFLIRYHTGLQQFRVFRQNTSNISHGVV